MPAYEDKWKLVTRTQKVDDIIAQVLRAHGNNKSMYDAIAKDFDGKTIPQICEMLYAFCERNITYREESTKFQTTAVPNGILYRGFGDCKHYASFCGGVLDALQRTTGRKIKWAYRFASYNDKKVPHHVFIVVWDKDGQEYWIDPVPGANDLTPNWIVDKKVNSESMPLYDNIGSLRNQVLNNYTTGYGASLGWTVETSAGYTTTGKTIVPRVGDPFYGTDWLGLSRYGVPTNTDVAQLTAELQAKINEGPAPYTLDKALVEKVLRDNVAYWNFYYPTGTSPTPRNWKSVLQNWLMLTITPDGRLTFDREAEPGHDTPLIHYLTDWTNFLVQAYSDKPYIPLIDHMKRFGKGWKTPDSGSLWHVIHEGDKNFAKITDFISNIPGLEEFLASYGVNLDAVISQAQKYLGPKQGLPGGANPGTGYPGQGGGGYIPPIVASGNNSMLFSAAAALVIYYFTKNIKYAAAAGIGTYFIMKKRQANVYNPQLPNAPIPTAPVFY